jgi:hypothetical protein
MNQDEQNKLQKEVSRSEKARQVLENPVFKDSIEKLKSLYTTSLFNTGVQENETREKLYLAYHIVQKVEQNIQEILDTGKLAKKQLEDYRQSIQKQKF